MQDPHARATSGLRAGAAVAGAHTIARATIVTKYQRISELRDHVRGQAQEQHAGERGRECHGEASGEARRRAPQGGSGLHPQRDQ